MKKIIIMAAVAVFIAFSLVMSYKALFLRTVNYEIAGVTIPSKYNILTGKVVPIKNYKGKTNLPVMQPSIKGNLGLSEEQAQSAKLRWALFEEWVTQMPQYGDWQSNPETFKKAMADFKNFIGEDV
ncbi:MAG: hypothetical protein WC404_00855 [Candidatus Omnitrophota bacterium]|jgi:hypothetical protein